MEGVMITLRDTVEIKTSPEKIFQWFAHLDKNFSSWHPKEHVACRYLKGNPLERNSVLYFEVYLLGKLQKARYRVTIVKPNSRIEYSMEFPLSLIGGRGAWIMEQRGCNSLFMNDLYLGTRVPLLGSVMDRLIQLFLGRLNRAFVQHMAEEDQNLKRIMEEGTALP
jgi:hypothetical protein